MSETDYETEFKTLQSVLSLLAEVSPAARNRIIKAISAFVSPSDDRPVEHGNIENKGAGSRSPRILKFAEDRSPGPKEFLLAKRPQSDVERVATLGYYLTHYRNQDEFKTADLTALNLEAGQPRIGNATRATDNAFRGGYLIQGTRGNKKISALGEQYIHALPDRDAAQEVMRDGQSSARGRRKKRK